MLAVVKRDCFPGDGSLGVQVRWVARVRKALGLFLHPSFEAIQDLERGRGGSRKLSAGTTLEIIEMHEYLTVSSTLASRDAQDNFHAT